MAYHDILSYLKVLEERGKLKRVYQEVDPSWELSCIARWMFQALPEKERFGLLFERVKGYEIPVMTGILGASRDVYAMALDVISDQINETWVRALRHRTGCSLISPDIVGPGTQGPRTWVTSDSLGCARLGRASRNADRHDR